MNVSQSLSQLYLFRNIPFLAVDALCKNCEVVSFPKNYRVIQLGSIGNDALLVVSGSLKVTIGHGPNSKKVGEVRPGEITGETALFAPGMERSADVWTLEPTTCIRITEDLLVRARGNQALVVLEEHLLSTLARRIRSTSNTIQRVWKLDPIEKDQPEEPEAKPSLVDRIRSLFGS